MAVFKCVKCGQGQPCWLEIEEEEVDNFPCSCPFGVKGVAKWRHVAGHSEALALRAENKRLKERVDELVRLGKRYKEGLQRIDNWAKAYPLKAFPEPDLKKVAEVLKAAGLSLDAVSASNMRHVIEGVQAIAQQALKGE